MKEYTKSELEQILLDSVDQQWQEVGAAAYALYLETGRGILVADSVSDLKQARFRYVAMDDLAVLLPQQSPELEMAQEYDPETQAVVAVCTVDRIGKAYTAIFGATPENSRDTPHQCYDRQTDSGARPGTFYKVAETSEQSLTPAGALI